jgi:tetraacyldisaccharide 4'-kinase
MELNRERSLGTGDDWESAMIGILMTPLELAYAAVLRAKNARYDRTEPARLQWPVVSVGNLSVGGSGKTPLVIRLAELLRERGFAPDVLSRGYGRASTTAERVNQAGTAARFGDEPLLIARAARVPVFVGASRYAAGTLAEVSGSDAARHVHLLDDGFQHRQLARAVDIVVVHPSDVKDRLLPVGRLREPLLSLKRAHILVLRQEDAGLESMLRRYARPDCYFWRVTRSLIAASDARRAVAFCGIGRPEEFFRDLAGAGTTIAARLSFRDHHLYTPKDMEKLVKLSERENCEEFVTTEKDVARLDTALLSQLTALAPLRVARLSLEIEDEAAAIGQLAAMLASGGGGESPGGLR